MLEHVEAYQVLDYLGGPGPPQRHRAVIFYKRFDIRGEEVVPDRRIHQTWHPSDGGYDLTSILLDLSASAEKR